MFPARQTHTQAGMEEGSVRICVMMAILKGFVGNKEGLVRFELGLIGLSLVKVREG